jgi:hypothetical protein
MFNWFRNRNKELSSYIFSYLNLLTADKKQHPKKMSTIISLARNAGMGTKELKGLIRDVDPSQIKLPLDNDEKFNHIFYLINLVSNDEQFDSDEFDFCIEMAALIGYNRSEAATIVREIYNGIKTKMKESDIKLRIEQILIKPSINFN